LNPLSKKAVSVYDLKYYLLTTDDLNFGYNVGFLAVPVYMYRDIDVIKSGGIELCGLKLSLAPRRQQSQAAPKLEKYSFVPYISDEVIFSDMY